MRHFNIFAAATAALALAACEVTVKDDQPAEQDNGAAQAPAAAPADPMAQQRTQARAQAAQGLENLHFVVDISDRNVRVLNGDQVLATHDVAVGTEKWPTPTGDFAFHRVDLNPEWIPPKDESWAEEREPKAPGAADNPMGKARLVYRMPNTIHGTNDLDSLGKASSHGSIRVANEVVLQLAPMLLKAGGAWDGDQWFQQMVQNSTKEFQIPLEKKIPIKVQD